MKIEEEEAKERQNEYQGYDRFHLRVVVWMVVHYMEWMCVRASHEYDSDTL